MFARLAIISAIVAASAALPALSSAASTRIASPAARNALLAPGTLLAQEEGDEEEAVPSDQVDKYIAVYTAMQKNHSLSVEQAASKQGMTVEQFRTLEDRIERNPVIHERVLDALKASASGKKATSSNANADPPRSPGPDVR